MTTPARSPKHQTSNVRSTNRVLKLKAKAQGGQYTERFSQPCRGFATFKLAHEPNANARPERNVLKAKLVRPTCSTNCRAEVFRCTDLGNHVPIGTL